MGRAGKLILPLTLRTLANCHGYSPEEIWYSCPRSFQRESSFSSWQALTDTHKQVRFERWGFRMQGIAYFSYYFFMSIKPFGKTEKNIPETKIQMTYKSHPFIFSLVLFFLWFEKKRGKWNLFFRFWEKVIWFFWGGELCNRLGNSTYTHIHTKVLTGLLSLSSAF